METIKAEKVKTVETVNWAIATGNRFMPMRSSEASVWALRTCVGTKEMLRVYLDGIKSEHPEANLSNHRIVPVRVTIEEISPEEWQIEMERVQRKNDEFMNKVHEETRKGTGNPSTG